MVIGRFRNAAAIGAWITGTHSMRHTVGALHSPLQRLRRERQATTSQSDLGDQAQELLPRAQTHLEGALLRDDKDEMWKAIASVNSATQGVKVAQFARRVEALEASSTFCSWTKQTIFSST